MGQNVTRIPHDILHEIILAICTDNLVAFDNHTEQHTYDDLRLAKRSLSLYRLTHISSQIRKMALSKPQLWTNLYMGDFCDKDELVVWLERSGDAPLRICMDAHESRRFESRMMQKWNKRIPESLRNYYQRAALGCNAKLEESVEKPSTMKDLAEFSEIFSDEILRRKERWQYIHFDPQFERYLSPSPNVHPIEGAFNDLLSLRTLRHTFSRVGDIYFASCLKFWNMPALESLILACIDLGSPQRLLVYTSESLTHLTLTDLRSTSPNGYSTLLKFLSGFPCLTHLTLGFVLLSVIPLLQFPIPTSLPGITLPALRQLQMKDSPDTTASSPSYLGTPRDMSTTPWSLISCLFTPNLQCAHLASNPGMPSMGYMVALRHYQTSMYKLDTVVISGSWVEFETWLALTELPHLSHLTVQDSTLAYIRGSVPPMFPCLRYAHFRWCNYIDTVAWFLAWFAGTVQRRPGYDGLETLELTYELGCEDIVEPSSLPFSADQIKISVSSD